ncbi:uncharacterized protein LOC129584010 [Paramacrobiotus metropolitanus]|uniref:uncharacterized protein LOC129584010 n=1 Tax=Paramacrobiotus metropolitanus TaxID=2943436 RepID=UPI0024465BC3|nr:uncharacterized protein LOC129584010 [Paramacrobiotus metropolitanus]
MNPREPRPRRRFGSVHRSGTEATAPPADSENEIFFSPPPTADLGGQVAGGGWGSHALQPHSRNVDVDDRMPNHASNPFRFPVAAPFREIPDTTDYRRRTAVATTCVQTSLIGEPHTAHYTDAFAQTNYGNRANQLSTRALPSDPHPQPSAPAVEEVYVKRGKEYHIVGNFDLATLNRMRSNGLQRMSSVTSTTIQHNVLTVQDQQPFERVAHGTPMRGAEGSLQQLHEWLLSPVLSATESPDHGRPFFVADRVKSLEKQARREAALDRDENTLQASFHSARTSFNQPPLRQHKEERQALRLDYLRRLIIWKRIITFFVFIFLLDRLTDILMTAVHPTHAFDMPIFEQIQMIHLAFLGSYSAIVVTELFNSINSTARDAETRNLANMGVLLSGIVLSSIIRVFLIYIWSPRIPLSIFNGHTNRVLVEIEGEFGKPRLARVRKLFCHCCNCMPARVRRLFCCDCLPAGARRLLCGCCSCLTDYKKQKIKFVLGSGGTFARPVELKKGVLKVSVCKEGRENSGFIRLDQVEYFETTINDYGSNRNFDIVATGVKNGPVIAKWVVPPYIARINEAESIE